LPCHPFGILYEPPTLLPQNLDIWSETFVVEVRKQLAVKYNFDKKRHKGFLGRDHFQAIGERVKVFFCLNEHKARNTYQQKLLTHVNKMNIP
jgi:hypothetical protein